MTQPGVLRLICCSYFMRVRLHRMGLTIPPGERGGKRPRARAGSVSDGSAKARPSLTLPALVTHGGSGYRERYEHSHTAPAAFVRLPRAGSVPAPVADVRPAARDRGRVVRPARPDG